MVDRIAFEAELRQAEAARLSGNEGRARVCARRAAGMAARGYLIRHRQAIQSQSAYDQLKRLASLDEISPEIRNVIDHFLLRVDETYQLPKEIDLIVEARWLLNELETL